MDIPDGNKSYPMKGPGEAHGLLAALNSSRSVFHLPHLSIPLELGISPGSRWVLTFPAGAADPGSPE